MVPKFRVLSAVLIAGAYDEVDSVEKTALASETSLAFDEGRRDL